MKTTQMKIICALTITAAFFATTIFGQCANQSNVFSFMYNGKNYEVVKETKTWANAAACAVSRGGYLAQINSQGEQTAIYNAITGGAAVSSTYTVVNDGGGIAYVWIGATDKNVEGTWLWDGNNDNVGVNFWNGQGNAGTGVGNVVGTNYINWGDIHLGQNDEPDNYLNQDAAAIGLASWPYGIAGEWNDIAITNSLYYVIEYDSTNGINNHEQKFQSQLYPNPANDFLNITSTNPTQQISDLKIYDQLGSLVYQKEKIKTGDVALDVSDFSEGIYFISLTFSNGEMENRKISVLK